MKSLKLILIATCASLLFSLNATAAESQIPSMTYYFFDGWPLCAKVTVIVNDHKKANGDKINITTVKVGDGNSAEEIKKAKLTNHGIIAKDKDGKLVTTVDGHNYGKDKVDEVVALLLAN